ncbi:MAG: RNA-binding domain-containing protein [Methanomassiliicoccus sp.]|nr:RNA-binding domain-containing protein [Methanomassiliicoccus sp.]
MGMLQITATAACRPTEDREKVRHAILNLIPDAQLEDAEGSLVGRSDSGEALREAILNQHIRDTARSVMLQGVRGNGTRFALNKQAAFMGKVSFIEGPVALGGIEVTVESDDIARTIDHLAESTVEDRMEEQE